MDSVASVTFTPVRSQEDKRSIKRYFKKATNALSGDKTTPERDSNGRKVRKPKGGSDTRKDEEAQRSSGQPEQSSLATPVRDMEQQAQSSQPDYPPAVPLKDSVNGHQSSQTSAQRSSSPQKQDGESNRKQQELQASPDAPSQNDSLDSTRANVQTNSYENAERSESPLSSTLDHTQHKRDGGSSIGLTYPSTEPYHGGLYPATSPPPRQKGHNKEPEPAVQGEDYFLSRFFIDAQSRLAPCLPKDANGRQLPLEKFSDLPKVTEGVRQLKGWYNAYAEDCQKLTKKNEKLLTAKESLEQELEDAKKGIRSLHEGKVRHSAELKSALNERESARSMVKELEKKHKDEMDSLHNQWERTQDELRKSEQASSDLSIKLKNTGDVATSRDQKNMQEIDRLDTRIKVLEQKLREAKDDKKMESLRRDLTQSSLDKDLLEVNVRDLRKKLEEAEMRFVQLQDLSTERLDVLRKELEEREDKFKQLQRNHSAVEMRLQLTEFDVNEKKETIRKFEETLQLQLQKSQDTHDTEVAKIRNTHVRELTETIRIHSEEVDKVKSYYDTLRANMAEEHRAAIEEKVTEYENYVKRAEAHQQIKEETHNRHVRGLQDSHENIIKEKDEHYHFEAQRLVRSHHDALRVVQIQSEEALRQHEKFVIALKQDFEVKENTYSQNHANLKASLEREQKIVNSLRISLSDKETSYEQALQDLEDKHQRDLDEAEENCELRVTLFKTQMNDLTRTQQAEVRDLTAAHEEKIILLKEQHDQAISTITLECEKLIAASASSLKGREERIKEILAEKDREHDEAVRIERLNYKNLQGKLIDRSDKFMPTPDDELQNNFTSVREEVKNLAQSPTNLSVDAICAHFNQPGFAKVVKMKREALLLLEHEIWMILFHGLFDNPLRVFGDGWSGYFNFWRNKFPERKSIR